MQIVLHAPVHNGNTGVLHDDDYDNKPGWPTWALDVLSCDDADTKPVRTLGRKESSVGCETSKHTIADACHSGRSVLEF
jgi:hypothetical protein